MLLLLTLYAVGTVNSELLVADGASCAEPISERPWAAGRARCLADADGEEEYTSAMQVSVHVAVGEARGQPARAEAGPEPSAPGAAGRAVGGAEVARPRTAGSSALELASAGTSEVRATNATGFGPRGHAPVPESVSVPFVVVKAQSQPEQNATTIEVHVATPNEIISTYIFLYGPCMFAWAAFLYLGSPDWMYRVVLPVTLTTMNLGVHLVNQSLAALMDAPVAITCVQAAFLCLIAGVWSLFSEIDRPSLGRHLLLPMAMWAGVAGMYTMHEMFSHLVSYESSLCERVVFMNLCPVLTHFIEEATDAPRLATRGTRGLARGALGLIVLGALVFSIQMPDMTFAGLAWVCLLMAQSVPFHLLERFMLVRWRGLPLPVLACYDAAFLLATSLSISTSQQEHFWESWQHWTSNSSILCMLALSLVVFCGHHVSELALLRVSTASCVLIYKNIANVVIVALGVVFFGEAAWSSPCAVIGIIISLAGGIWYAIETTPLTDAKEVDAGTPGSPSLANSQQRHLRSESSYSLSQEG